MVCLSSINSLPWKPTKNILNKPKPPVWKLKAGVLSCIGQPDTGNKLQQSRDSLCCLSHTELPPQHTHTAQTPHECQGWVKKLHLLPALQELVSSRHTQDPAALPSTDPCARTPGWPMALSKAMKHRSQPSSVTQSPASLPPPSQRTCTHPLEPSPDVSRIPKPHSSTTTPRFLMPPPCFPCW